MEQIKCPLSHSQLNVFYDQIKSAANPFYNVGGYIDINNADIEKLIIAHKTLVSQNDIFGLRIHITDESISQSISDVRKTELPQVDFRQYAAPVEQAKSWLDELFATPISMENNELFKAFILRVSATRVFYVGLAHHIMMDGIGFVNWSNRLGVLYSNNEIAELKSIPYQVRKTLDRETQYHGSSAKERDKEYWLNQVTKFDVPPFSARNSETQLTPVKQSFRVSLPYDDEFKGLFESIAKRQDTKAHQIIWCLLGSFICLSNSVDKLLVGFPFHNRKGPEKDEIDLAMSIVPGLLSIDSESSFSTLYQSAIQSQKKLLRHRRFPLSDIVNLPGYKRVSSSPFDFTFSYLSAGDGPLFGTENCELKYWPHNHSLTPISLTLWEVPTPGKSELQFDLSSNYFDQTMVQCWLRDFKHFVSQIASNVNRKLSSLALSAPKPQEVFSTLANSESVPPLSIDFLTQAKENRSTLSSQLVVSETLISTGELIDSATKYLSFLVSRFGLKAGDKVVVYVPRCADFIKIAIGLIQQGIVFVPVDKQVPEARLDFILKDSDAKVLITDSPLPSVSCPTLLLNDLRSKAAVSQADELPPATGLQETHLAYIFYTSGSTGQPKGVAVSRKALENFLTGFIHTLSIKDNKNWLCVSSFGFDISLVEWLGCLAVGATCHLISEEEYADAFAITRLLNDSNIDFVQATVSRLTQMLDAGWVPNKGSTIVSAGEPLTKELAQRLCDKDIKLWNAYGPTEACVYSLLKPVSREESNCSKIAIGNPLPGYRHYVVNKDLTPVPGDTAGELLIAGVGLAQGYVNLPKLTQRQFCTSDFIDEKRLYRTGDKVKLHSDGNLEYLGRLDEQVKLRGYRIETSEISGALRSIEGVMDAATVVQTFNGNQNSILVSFVVSNSPQEPPEESTLLASLRTILPAYMVPEQLVYIESIPWNTNGKLDKKNLPQIACSKHTVNVTTEEQKFMRQLWSEVLGVLPDEIGLNSHFFEAGGNSVSAVRLIARLRENFQEQIGLDVLHTQPIFEEFTNVVFSKVSFDKDDNLDDFSDEIQTMVI